MSLFDQILEEINENMLQRVLWILCSSALVSAGVIGTDYSPATLVSYSSISTPVVTKTISTPIIEKTITTPVGYTNIIKSSPIYESVLTTQESNYKTPDGAHHTAYSKSLDTSYSSIKKYESKTSKNGDGLANSIPAFYTATRSPIIYHHPETAYTISPPLYHSIASPVVTKSVSVPVTYTAHSVPLTKTISAPITSYTTPVLEKTKILSAGVSTFSPHSPVIEAQTHTKSVSFPLTYTTHDTPLTKSISAPAITAYTTPVLEKTKVVSSELPTYSSYTPVYEAPTHIKSVSVPVTYTTHSIPLTKTYSAPIISYTPVVEKTKVVSSGLSLLSSHTPIIGAQGDKTTFAYSDAPVVSRMSFSGLGTSYAW